MHPFYGILKNLRTITICTLASTLFLYLSSCSVLPTVTKVHPGHINKKGVLFMLPKADIYASFLKTKTDSVKGLIAPYPQLIERLTNMYYPEEIKKPIKNTRTIFKYTDFRFIEKLVQDTTELYSLNICKNKNRIFTNLEFCLSLSEIGTIQSTDMTVENQATAVIGTLAGFAFNSIVPFTPFSSASRGAKDSAEDNMHYKMALKLLTSLDSIKRLEKKISIEPKLYDDDFEASQYILDKLCKSEETILTVLLGKSTTTIIDSVIIPLNIGKDTLYIIETGRHGKQSYSVKYGSEGGASLNYLFKIEPEWLTNFTNATCEKKTTGLPYKMPEHIKLYLLNYQNELVTSDEMIVPSNSTFYLPNKLGALKSHMKVDYNPNGTINNISSGYTSATPEDTKALLGNFDMSQVQAPAPKDKSKPTPPKK
jgi:hypothetical protein